MQSNDSVEKVQATCNTNTGIQRCSRLPESHSKQTSNPAGASDVDAYLDSDIGRPCLTSCIGSADEARKSCKIFRVRRMLRQETGSATVCIGENKTCTDICPLRSGLYVRCRGEQTSHRAASTSRRLTLRPCSIPPSMPSRPSSSRSLPRTGRGLTCDQQGGPGTSDPLIDRAAGSARRPKILLLQRCFFSEALEDTHPPVTKIDRLPYRWLRGQQAGLCGVGRTPGGPLGHSMRPPTTLVATVYSLSRW